jgi:hypothetical protein
LFPIDNAERVFLGSANRGNPAADSGEKPAGKPPDLIRGEVNPRDEVCLGRALTSNGRDASEVSSNTPRLEKIYKKIRNLWAA